MKLIVSRRATRRIYEISDYIHVRNPQAALFVRKGIQDAFLLLAAYPDAGRSLELGVRRFLVPRLPYLIYYRVAERESAVVIITIRHAAQRQPSPGDLA